MALRILDSNRNLSDLDGGVHGCSADADGLSLDELDNGVLSLKDNLTEGEVPSIDSSKAMVPDSKPSARRKRRTEVENLEIDLKGWNYVSCNVRSLLSDKRPSRDINNFLFDEEQSGN